MSQEIHIFAIMISKSEERDQFNELMRRMLEIVHSKEVDTNRYLMTDYFGANQGKPTNIVMMETRVVVVVWCQRRWSIPKASLIR